MCRVVSVGEKFRAAVLRVAFEGHVLVFLVRF